MSYAEMDPSEGVTPLGKKGSGAYLSPQQFMSMHKIHQLAPLDSAGSMSDLIDMKRDQVANNQGDTEDYGALKKTMAREGPKGTTVPPILATPGPTAALANGGHRLAIATDLGYKYMRHTSDPSTSGYNDNRFTHSWDDPDDDNPEPSDESDESGSSGQLNPQQFGAGSGSQIQ